MIVDLDRYRKRRKVAATRDKFTGWQVEADWLDDLIDSAGSLPTYDAACFALWLHGFRPRDFENADGVNARSIYEEGLEQLEAAFHIPRRLANTRRSSPLVCELIVQAWDNWNDDEYRQGITKEVMMAAYRSMEEFPQFDKLRRRIAASQFDPFEALPHFDESDTTAALWTLLCLIADNWKADPALKAEMEKLLWTEYYAGTL